MKVLCLDIGGTFIKYALMEEDMQFHITMLTKKVFS